jgi:alpha-glucosidase
MKKNLIICVFAMAMLLNSGFSPAQNALPVTPGNGTALSKTSDGVLIEAERAKMLITVYAPTVVRFRLVQGDFGRDFSYAVIRKPAGGFRDVITTGTGWELKTDSLQLTVNKSPLSVTISDLKGGVLCAGYSGFSYTWQGTEVTTYNKLFPDEKFIGLGEKTGNLDRRGSKYDMWNSDVPAYGVNDDPLYVSIPFYMGIHDKRTYGIFLDNTFRTQFDFAASSDNQFSRFSAADGEMNYYFFGASSIARIIEDYTWLTGRMKMPPMWSLGYQQSRWSYFPDTEVVALAEKFREKKIPCDVIYLDIDYMDSYKIFTWNKERFPQPKEMIARLNGMGFHLATIVDPGIKVEKGYFAYDEGVKNDYFAKYPDGQYYIGSVWPGRCHFPDFTREDVRNWWGRSFSRLVEPGVEGFWNDMNEPSAWGQNIPNIVLFDYDGDKSTIARAHNIYGLEMSRATCEGTTSLLNGKRPFVLTRAGYAGIQRYSAVWTGDNEATDDHMLLACRIVNSMGLSGISFAGPDLGGFIGNPSKELYQRWLNLGVFTPFFRNHSAWDTKAKEPWSFGADVEKRSIEMISLRYKLLPYIYSAFYQSAQTGMPVARTLAINYMNDEKIWWWSYQNQYMFGDNLLVAPVSCNQNFAKVYLPEGGWYRLNSTEYFKGNSEVIVEAPIHNLPVFVKASAIIPMQSAIQFTDQKPSPVLELHLYKGEHASEFTYYEDDGNTYNYETGSFYKRTLRYIPAEKMLIFGKPEGTFTPKFTTVRLILHGFDNVMTIQANGKEVSLKLSSSGDRFGEFPLTTTKFDVLF